MARVIYSPRYNIRAHGLERFHPFDTRKYGRAWVELHRRYGRRLRDFHVVPPGPISHAELLAVHTPDYLASLGQASTLAEALELPMLGRFPVALTTTYVVHPIQWGTMGTVTAAREAMAHGLGINLSGGYHHAKPHKAEGFSIYSDVAVAVAQLRKEGALGLDDRIAYIDLDAHHGNGVCSQFLNDRRFFILDMYNQTIYPAQDVASRSRIDCDLPLLPLDNGEKYLGLLRDHLPGFLDGIARSGPVRLGIYNAGTDVFMGDRLGGLRLSGDDVLARDLYVVEQLRSRNIPTVMVLSGGYCSESYRLVAASVGGLLAEYGGSQ